VISRSGEFSYIRQQIIINADKPNPVANAIGYAMHYSRLHAAVIRVYDDAGNLIET